MDSISRSMGGGAGEALSDSRPWSAPGLFGFFFFGNVLSCPCVTFDCLLSDLLMGVFDFDTIISALSVGSSRN